jgi:hypothetical protein
VESKTIRVKRSQPRDVVQFDDAVGALRLFTSEFDIYEELDVTITVPKSPEERLREARRDALTNDLFSGGFTPALCSLILDTIERVDAEFAKGEGGG